MPFKPQAQTFVQAFNIELESRASFTIVNAGECVVELAFDPDGNDYQATLAPGGGSLGFDYQGDTYMGRVYVRAVAGDSAPFKVNVLSTVHVCNPS